MKERIESAKNEFLQARDGLLRALSTTPDERLNWSPSPSARTPLHLAAHAAQSIGHIHGFLNDIPFAVSNPEEADREFRASEQAFTRRAEVVNLLETNADAFVSWLDDLAPERLGTLVTPPFGMDPVPMEIAITFPAMHTRWHHAQLDYLQTAYDDRDWHMD